MKPNAFPLLSLLVAALFALGMLGSADVEAAPRKKQVVKAKSKKSVTRAPLRAKLVRGRQPQVEFSDAGMPLLRSASVMVQDLNSGNVLFEKNAGHVVPIASITKLMTAMVVLDAAPDLNEVLQVSEEDVDNLRHSSSRLGVGTALSREDMLRLALMSSENRAANALGRYYPGGLPAFVAAMNAKAKALDLSDTRFADPTGLNAANVSSARDLVKMTAAASSYPLIREFSTMAEYSVSLNGRQRAFRNTNALVKTPGWEIGVSKTGYINEAGKCLVMQAWLNNKPMIIVLLDSWGRMTRIADAIRIKRWIETMAGAGANPG